MEQAVFYGLLRELQKHRLRSFTASPTMIQSSVALILRYDTQKQPSSLSTLLKEAPLIENVEVLLVQRSGHATDLNAYNIALPGGQADPGETDLVACKREVAEEVGLDLNDCLHAGQLPSNFYYSRKKGKEVYISCHVWLLHSSVSYRPQLSSEELIAYRWVPMSQILDPNSFTKYSQAELSLLRRMGWEKKIADKVRGHFVQASLPALNVGMDRSLWGVTLWILVYALQMASNSLQGGNHPQARERISNIVKAMGYIELEFKPGFVLAKPLRWIVQKWNLKHRVRPFTYPPLSSKRVAIPYLLAFLVVLFFLTTMFL